MSRERLAVLTVAATGEEAVEFLFDGNSDGTVEQMIPSIWGEQGF